MKRNKQTKGFHFILGNGESIFFLKNTFLFINYSKIKVTVSAKEVKPRSQNSCQRPYEMISRSHRPTKSSGNEPRDGLSGFSVCLRICGQWYLLELTLKKLNWCHIFHATDMSNYKMKEVLITLPTCLARFPPQLSEELANIRLDSQTVFLLFSSSCSVL